MNSSNRSAISIPRKPRLSVSGRHCVVIPWLCILTVCLLPVGAWSQTVISSLPYTVSTSNTNYVINTTLHATDRAITINSGVHDVTIYQSDPTNDTIYWGESGADGMHGFQVNNNAYNITIHDLNFVLNAPTESLIWSNTGFCAISFQMGSGVHDLTFRDSYVRIAGRGSQAWNDGGNYNMSLRNIKWDNQSTSFPRRDQMAFYSMVSIYNMDSRAQSGFGYHYHIDRCSTLAANWVNYYLAGNSAVVWVDSCHLFVDALNEVPDNGIEGSAEQCYAIITGNTNSSTATGSNIKITNNTFRSGDDHAGGDAIASGILGGDTTESQGVWIYNNDIRVHKGWAGEASTAYATQFRQYASNVVFRKNIVYASGGTDDDESAYCDFVAGMRIYATYAIPANIIIDSNEFHISFRDLTAAGSPSGLVGAYGVVCGAGGSAEGIDFRYNKMAAGTAPYLLGEPVNGNDNADGFVIGDTLEILDSGTTNQWSIYGVVSGSTNNRFRGCQFIETSGATLQNIGFSASGDAVIANNFRVHVQTGAGTPLSGATVRITNGYNQTVVASAITNALGNVDTVLTYRHESNSYDSTGFNPFTLRAIYGTDSVIITGTVVGLSPNASDTLTLTNLDTIPPAMVGDLSVVPASTTGYLTFGWTSTGDDGTVGTASYDSIRYSTAPIDENNWAFATAYPRTAAPKAYGIHDQVTVAEPAPIGPVGGRFYYVGIRAYDEVHNASPLSTASGFARGILRPQISTDSIVIDQGADPPQVTFFAAVVPSYLEHYYEFQLDSDQSFSSPTTVNDTMVGTYAEATFPLPPESDTVQLRCRAVALDHSETSPWSPTRAFSDSGGFVNSPPGAPTPFSPVADDIVTSLRPVLVINNSEDPDQDVLTYEFAVHDAAGTTLLASSGPVAQASPRTTWTVPAGVLQDNTEYAWRARSYDGHSNSAWMDLVPFRVLVFSTGEVSPAPVFYAYPNPVRFAAGEQATFVLPDEPVTLTILTVSGNVVLFRSNISGQWQWDGSNQSGSRVAAGVYAWFLSDDRGHGKLVVKP
jgi:hypothetical protein